MRHSFNMAKIVLITLKCQCRNGMNVFCKNWSVGTDRPNLLTRTCFIKIKSKWVLCVCGCNLSWDELIMSLVLITLGSFSLCFIVVISSLYICVPLCYVLNNSVLWASKRVRRWKNNQWTISLIWCEKHNKKRRFCLIFKLSFYVTWNKFSYYFF